MVNPADAVSWLRVLLLLKGVGHRSAEPLIERLVASPEPGRELAQQAQAKGKYEGMARLAELLSALSTEARPADHLAAVLEYYLPLMREAYPDDYPKRERDLEHFQTITERYRSLGSMLADMALEPPNDSIGDLLAVAPEEEGLVTLSTIHSAKGLEWKVVFLIWAAEGRFPAPQSADPESLEEERRLMYVAGTRARDELYISYPIHMFDRSRGYVMGSVSRFPRMLHPRSCRSRDWKKITDPERAAGGDISRCPHCDPAPGGVRIVIVS